MHHGRGEWSGTWSFAQMDGRYRAISMIFKDCCDLLVFFKGFYCSITYDKIIANLSNSDLPR